MKVKISDVKYFVSLKSKTLDKMVVGDTIESWHNDEAAREIIKLGVIAELPDGRKCRIAELENDMIVAILEPVEELIPTGTIQ